LEIVIRPSYDRRGSAVHDVYYVLVSDRADRDGRPHKPVWRCPVEKGLLKIEEAAEYLSLGRSKTYELLQPRGPLPIVRIGKSVRVPAAALQRWVEEQTATAGEQA
jgi:excisionase family DNA binding protein